jgi:hypothetical protein
MGKVRNGTKEKVVLEKKRKEGRIGQRFLELVAKCGLRVCEQN